MPAEKTLRRQNKMGAQNRTIRTATRNRIVAARASVEADAKSDGTAASVKLAVQALDRAVTKGVIHPNNAARRKSRLMHTLHKAQAEAKA